MKKVIRLWFKAETNRFSQLQNKVILNWLISD